MFLFKDCKAYLILIIVWLASCQSDNNISSNSQAYFSLKSYFKSEATRLRKSGPAVKKSISDNGQAEIRTVHIDNWDTELALFSESDINKPAWKDSYHTKTSARKITYKAKEPNLRTRQIVIFTGKDRYVQRIDIDNQDDNFLYKTREKLTYIPDSGYVIKKHQAVRVLGSHDYIVEGWLR